MKERHFHKYAFIATTIFSSAIGFIKSYLFMDMLTKMELGYIAIFQSIIVVIGFLQAGTITGGYRMISFSKDRYRSANNAVMTYLFLLYIVVSAVLIAGGFIFGFNWYLIIGTVIGIATLWTNWWTNLQIGLGRTSQLSLLLSASVLISMIGAPVMYYAHITGAILLLALQPVAFILLAYFFNRDFHFRLGLKSLPYFKLIAKYGFVPFFAGILYYVNQQLERWIISYDLGIESLGEYYLVFVYGTIFTVIPAALATLNFPKMMKALRNNIPETFSFRGTFGVYYLELILYCVAGYIGTYFILPYLVAYFLPAHTAGVDLVKIIYWGLVPYVLVDPLSFVLNARLHYRELLYIYFFALAVSISSYAFLHFSHQASLRAFAFVNIIFLMTIAAGYFCYFIVKGKKTLYG